jgi:hypothetical protein
MILSKLRVAGSSPAAPTNLFIKLGIMYKFPTVTAVERFGLLHRALPRKAIRFDIDTDSCRIGVSRQTAHCQRCGTSPHCVALFP